jgi:hypothetical protein
MAASTEVVLYDQALFPALLDQDPAVVRERFAKRFAAATDVDDLFSILQGNTSKDMVGKAITINSVAWAPYESDRGIIPLAVCDAVDINTGEVLEFATTGEMLTMFIRQAELIDVLPLSVRITSKKTRSGNNALNFERP